MKTDEKDKKINLRGRKTNKTVQTNTAIMLGVLKEK